MKRLLLVLPLVALLTACTQVDDAPVAQSASVPPAAPAAPGLCLDAGPQTPRDITSATGSNPVQFPFAPRPPR